MTNVIEFPGSEDFKNVTYIDDNGDLGVSTRDRSLGIYRLSKNEFEIVPTSSVSFVLDRATLAEFLQVAKVFVDPEDKHKPDMDMVGCDY